MNADEGRMTTANSEPVASGHADARAEGSPRAGLGTTSLAVAVVVVALFHPLLQFVPTFLPSIAVVIGSGVGAMVRLAIEGVGLVIAFLLATAAVVTRRGRAQGLGALVIAVTVGASIVQTFMTIRGEG
jgi:uncharacterized membrane protein YqaE (UPF0057 family)